MDRLEEIKKARHEAGFYKDITISEKATKKVDWLISEIERKNKALEFIQQWAAFDNIDSITDAETVLSKIQSRAYQALKEG